MILQSTTRNRILRAVPSEVFERISPKLEPVEMTRGHMIDRVDGPIEYMYFVERGLVSIVKSMRDGRVVEVGAVGSEGVTDVNALFGLDLAVLETVVQVPGNALRIKRDDLAQQMERDASFRGLMQAYARFALGQLAQTAACNRLHTIEERCCRWLLVAHDSVGGDTIDLTQEFLSMMLGVQRTGVSLVANTLKKAGLIDYTRGRVSILSRHGLEDASCECYQDQRVGIDNLFPQNRIPVRQ